MVFEGSKKEKARNEEYIHSQEVEITETKHVKASFYLAFKLIHNRTI